jgi:hypothetical protein
MKKRGGGGDDDECVRNKSRINGVRLRTYTMARRIHIHTIGQWSKIGHYATLRCVALRYVALCVIGSTVGRI